MRRWPLAWFLLAAAAAGQEAPRVVRLTPAHGSVDVDWQQKTLEVHFDRDMATTGFASRGGGITFPRVTATEWLDLRTVRISVVLDPDSVYSLELACAGGRGFVSKDGVRLPATPWRFCTTATTPPTAAAMQQRNQRAYDLLMAAVRDRYSYRDRIGIDWKEQFDNHRADILAAPSPGALALAIADLLAVAQDPHITVQFGKGMLPTMLRAVQPNVRQDSLQKALPGLRQVDKDVAVARTADGIGYLQLSTFRREDRDQVDRAIDALRQLRDCKALILDVRLASGGDENVARSLAAWFVREQRVYAGHTTRNPESPGGFDERQDRSIRGNPEPDRYDGPVAVLTGPMIMSSAEAFLLMMRQAKEVRLVGAPSYGSSGNPKPFALAPGLSVLLPSWRALRPDATCFEGEGIFPDIRVEAGPADFAQGDPVLQKALEYLRAQ